MNFKPSKMNMKTRKEILKKKLQKKQKDFEEKLQKHLKASKK